MAHLSDADLIRLRDGECEGLDVRAFREHLETCVKCKENARRIDRLIDGLASAIGEIKHPKDIQLPRRFSSRRKERHVLRSAVSTWLARRPVKIAAALAVVAVAVLSAAPARAVVKSGWQAVVDILTRAPARQVSSNPVQPPVPVSVSADSAVAQPMSKRASFAPQDDEFSIVLAHAQSAGTLSVASDSVSRVTVVALGDADSDQLVVFRTGVRIVNTASSTTSYEFVVPSVLQSVVVQVAGRTVATLLPGELLLGRASWRLDLAGELAR